MFKFLIKITVWSLILTGLGCSKLSPSKYEITLERGNVLQTLIKQEMYSQIYQNSASCMKSNYTEEQFVSVMKEAMDKLKSIDEKLEFLDYDETEKDLNNKWLTFQNYGIGYKKVETIYDNKPEKFLRPESNNHAMILTAWQDDEDSKLAAFQILVNKGETKKWYGTSSYNNRKRNHC